MDTKVKIGYGLGFVMYGGCLCAAWALGQSPQSTAINFLLCIFGGVLGWVVGILLTPKSDEEAQNFQKVGGAILSFVTGYLVSKADILFKQATEQKADMDAMLGKGLLFGSAFLVGALFVFVGRSYVNTRNMNPPNP